MDGSLLDRPGRTVPAAALQVLFASTMFVSAGLLFVVEPMIARMILPVLGGSPSVWSTCLVFFQAVLLAGYAYAHLLTRALPLRGQVCLHAGILAASFLSLPMAMDGAGPPSGGSPLLWLLGRLAVTAGPAAFAIAATAPLLQSWFARLGLEASADPYFLYAGSNAGSLLALLAYPLLLEPALRLDAQAAAWRWGFLLLAAGILLCAMTLRITAFRAPFAAAPRATRSWRRRLHWLALAAVPSSLLLGVTTHITADIASAPLLWVVPLVLYLLSFILAFARRPPVPHALMIRTMPLLVIPLVLTMSPGLFMPLPVLMLLHLGGLFVACMVFHGELARLRPPAGDLTEFYVFLSAGGVIGGLFNALLAPLLFTGIWEYPLALVAACLLKPADDARSARLLVWDVLLAAALLALVGVALRVFGMASEGGHVRLPTAVLGFLIPGLALLHSSTRRVRFGLGVAACLLASAWAGSTDAVLTARSFFGVYRVRDVQDATGRYLIEMHGTSMHGARSLAAGEATQPMAYYNRAGPFGQLFRSLPAGSVKHVAGIGLGTGELGCYAVPGQDWTFYEIDGLVERIARNGRYFDFLTACGNHPKVILGDARLTIAGAPDGAYDLLILDAFSSDSIPMHLLTREALALYLRKLAPGGRLLFHISSRSLDLRPVIGALAADAGLQARTLAMGTPPRSSLYRQATAQVVVLARPVVDLTALRAGDGWQPLAPGGPAMLWTDQKSDLLGVIRLGY